jgi:CBS domain-containing protein
MLIIVTYWLDHATLCTKILPLMNNTTPPFDTVEDALRIFKTNHFHAVPVVEGDRQLVGILSTYDLIKMLERILAPEVDYAEE